MAMTAPRKIKCGRCLEMIEQGAGVETFGAPVNGVPQYAHVGCKVRTPAERAIIGAKVNQAKAKLDTEDLIGDDDELFDEVVTAAGKLAADGLAQRTGVVIGESIRQILPGMKSQVQAELTKVVTESVGAEVRNSIASVTSEFTLKIKELTEQVEKHNKSLQEKATKEINAQLKSIKNRQEVVHRVEINGSSVEFGKEEVFHRCFDRILGLAAIGKNILLVGPSGCGKTHTAGQVARVLGRRFAYINCTAGTTESEFIGSSFPNIATGQSIFLTTEFLDYFENGGVFLLDEADSLDPNCFLKLNSALANGMIGVPKRFDRPKAVKHSDFLCIVAANTRGQGSNRQYTGRNRLDGATIDRFKAGTVAMDYDENVEARYACPDANLHKTFLGWRKAIADGGFERILSTRVIRDFYELHTKLGYTVDKLADILVDGWTDREAIAVIGRKGEPID